MTAIPFLLHCLACDDVQYLTTERRVFCRCERTSARRDRARIIVAGPGRIVAAGGAPVDDAEIVRPSVAVGT